MNTPRPSLPLPPPSSAPLVRLDRVSAGFGGVPVFSHLSLTLYQGEHLVLAGPNGAGKSTLLRLLQGDIRPLPHIPPDPPGRVWYAFDGVEDASALNAREHVRTVSPAMQRNYARQGWKISGEEILLSGLDNAAMLYGEVSAREYERAVRLAESAGAAHLLGMQAPAMSQGQLRLALILRALMSRPALLLLDEPFDGLDAPARESVGRCIALAAERGSTLVVSAHRKEDIPDGIASALVFTSGGLARRPAHPPESLFAPDASTWPSAPAGDSFFVEANRVQMWAPPTPARTWPALDPANGERQRFTIGHNEDCCSITQPFSVPESSGPPRSPQLAHPPAQDECAFVRDIRALGPDGPPLFELSGVAVYIDRKQVLTDVNWSVRKGERWAVAGRNGSGKSTLLRLLYGEEFAAYGGTLLWCGKPRPGLDELRHGVGYVSDRLQDVYDYDLSAEAVVVSGLRGHIGLYEEPAAEELAVAREWLARMGLAHAGASPFFSLSSGTARRVLLARALAASPPVLLLDEPCSGLDKAGRALFFQALENLAARGVTLIHVSHRSGDACALFNRELRLEEGRVISSGAPHCAGAG